MLLLLIKMYLRKRWRIAKEQQQQNNFSKIDWRFNRSFIPRVPRLLVTILASTLLSYTKSRGTRIDSDMSKVKIDSGEA